MYIRGTTSSLVTNTRHAQAIIVGGGPAGASTAWHLARAGIDVLLLDRARFPRSKPCAEYVSPEAARILHAMNVLGQIDAADSTALTGMTVVAPSGSTICGNFLSTHGFRGFRDAGIGCRREILDTLILDAARAAHVRVHEHTKVEQLLFDANGKATGVVARNAHGTAEEFRAHIVIGADGLRSTVAHRLGLSHSTRWPNRIAIMAHYNNVTQLTTHGEMHVTSRGYFGLARVGNDVVNVALVVPSATLKRERDPRPLLDNWIAAQPALARRFGHAMQCSPVRVTGPFASRAKQAVAPGALLVGDAADFFDPFTGEGIYAALRGGELAAPFVIEAIKAYESGDSRTALQSLSAYHDARVSTFGGKWRVEWLIGLAVANPWLMNGAARLLARDREVADLLVGVTGDFVPTSEVLTPRLLLRLLRATPARRQAQSA